MSKKNEREVKVVLVGESGVGKSSIALRFVNNHFKTITASTIGASFLSKSVVFKNNKIKYNIWDTAGQEKYRSLASMYYKGAECAIVVFDVTSRDTFEQAEQYWIPEVLRECGSGASLCIAGNKADLVSERQVSEEEGRAFAASHGASYFETSAKIDQNVQELFQVLASQLTSLEAVEGSDRSKTYSLSYATNSQQPQTADNSFLSYCC